MDSHRLPFPPSDPGSGLLHADVLPNPAGGKIHGLILCFNKRIPLSLDAKFNKTLIYCVFNFIVFFSWTFLLVCKVKVYFHAGEEVYSNTAHFSY